MHPLDTPTAKDCIPPDYSDYKVPSAEELKSNFFAYNDEEDRLLDQIYTRVRRCLIYQTNGALDGNIPAFWGEPAYRDKNWNSWDAWPWGSVACMHDITGAFQQREPNWRFPRLNTISHENTKHEDLFAPWKACMSRLKNTGSTTMNKDFVLDYSSRLFLETLPLWQARLASQETNQDFLPTYTCKLKDSEGNMLKPQYKEWLIRDVDSPEKAEAEEAAIKSRFSTEAANDAWNTLTDCRTFKSIGVVKFNKRYNFEAEGVPKFIADAWTSVMVKPVERITNFIASGGDRENRQIRKRKQFIIEVLKKAGFDDISETNIDLYINRNPNQPLWDQLNDELAIDNPYISFLTEKKLWIKWQYEQIFFKNPIAEEKRREAQLEMDRGVFSGYKEESDENVSVWDKTLKKEDTVRDPKDYVVLPDRDSDKGFLSKLKFWKKGP